jgi:molecular chaperone HtpG
MSTQNKETHDFQAEIQQLLKLMIHSLYSNKEIFLRELISNASDAADKLRFEAINHPNWYEDDSDLSIQVAVDQSKNTITISDNGIGMSREEIITNLGTIAKSGTKEFFSKLSGDQQKDASLIGQFGVGFYSGFIVADSISVESRKAGLTKEQAVRWESAGDGAFTVEQVSKDRRGTTITLHIKHEESELLNSWKIKSIIRKYSDHISIPIQMFKEEWSEESKSQVIKDELETINEANALWTRNKNDISEDQYHAFYKNISNDFENPLSYSHNRVEGRSEFTQLLYIPKKASFDLWDRSKRSGIKLYVKRVFIMDDSEQLLPTYLRFISGIIDSADLPLNVSREILQESKDVKFIRESSTKRVLSQLEDLSSSVEEAKREDYQLFWNAFGQVLKEGLGEDHANVDKLSKLLRFANSTQNSDIQNVSLSDYVSRMKEGQDKIYFVTADSYLAAKNSPHLEIFNKKGIEVLLLTDRIDEWMLSFLTTFDNKPLTSVAKGDLDLGSLTDVSEKEEQKEAEKEFVDLLDRMKKVLSEKAKDVRLTFRLTDSPACLVADENELSGNLLRMLKAAGQPAPDSKPILEINTSHPLVKKVQSTSVDFEEWAHTLFDQALIAEGGQLSDPGSFVKRINHLLLN